MASGRRSSDAGSTTSGDTVDSREVAVLATPVTRAIPVPVASRTTDLRRQVLVGGRYQANSTVASLVDSPASPVVRRGPVSRLRRRGSFDGTPTHGSARTPVRTPVARLAWTPAERQEAREISILSTVCLSSVEKVTDLLVQLQRSALRYKPGRSLGGSSAARKAVYKQVQCNMIGRGLLPGMFPQSPAFGLQVPGSPPNDTKAAWQEHQAALAYRETRLTQLLACLTEGTRCFAVDRIDMRASGLSNKKAVGKAVYYFMTTASMQDEALRSTVVHDGAHVVYGAGGAMRMDGHAVGSAPVML